jgi:hypothetical protein
VSAGRPGGRDATFPCGSPAPVSGEPWCARRAARASPSR